jgi:hypothetical protein
MVRYMSSDEDRKEEWQAMELVYGVDAERVTKQLEFCLIFRGWAITIFAGVISAMFIYQKPLIAIAGIVSCAIFWYSECRYDARRMLFQKRINEIEGNVLHERTSSLEKRMKLEQNVLSQGFPLFTDEPLTYDVKKAEKLARRRPVRLVTYSTLVTVLVILLLTMLLA